MSSMEDRMIEAVERDGVDPDEAYDVVRDRMAEAADSGRLTDAGYENPRAYDKPGSATITLAKDRLWVNEERTVMVRLWSEGGMEVATRETPAHTWGPPKYLKEETC